MFVPVAPVLIFKIYVNSFFILMTNKRESYKGENIAQVFLTVFIGPFMIILSITMDLISLPNTLFKDSNNFEHKY